MPIPILSAGLRSNLRQPILDEMASDFELIEIAKGESSAEIQAKAAQANIFFGSMLSLTPDLLGELKGYRLVQLTSSGYDTIDVEMVRQHKIPLATNGGANATAVAEHTIMLMLATLRHLGPHNARVRSGGWDTLYVEEPTEIAGKCVGLVGFGRIGQEVARRLASWGVKLVYFDPFPASKDVEERLQATYLPLNELLASADIISLHVPLSPTTQKFIGQDTLMQVKRNVRIINTSRGGLVDEDALYAAIVDGRVAAAGLDVFGEEPAQNNKLFGLKNVVCTPHTAGNSSDVWIATARICVDNIRHVVGGGTPRFLIPEAR